MTRSDETNSRLPVLLIIKNSWRNGVNEVLPYIYIYIYISGEAALFVDIWGTL